MIHRESIHKYRRPSLLVREIASLNVAGRRFILIPSILVDRVALVVVIGWMCPQQWLNVT
jgi:hypothetical protein